jgi:hypothetical protein
MWQLARTRPILMAAFALAVALTIFFASRLVVNAVYWANPDHQNQRVAPWMTVGYIAQSWDVEPDELDAIAQLPQPSVKGHPQPLIEIATDRGVPVATVIAEVEAALAILAARTNRDQPKGTSQ